MGPSSPALIDLAGQIVSAYVSNHPVDAEETRELLDAVASVMTSLSEGTSVQVPQAKPVPAVPIKKSVSADYLICLEDGKKLKMLKRHLQAAFGMTPEQYRERWGLPEHYPMVAPSYAQKRSSLAKVFGLGKRAMTEPG